MSNSNQVLARNATDLAVSTPAVSDVDLLTDIVARNMRRVVKPGTITIERHLLNKSKLFSSCAGDYKSHRGISKSDRLDNETAAKLDEIIADLINKRLGCINANNALTFRSYLHHDIRNRRVTKRHQGVGEDMITLREQVLGMNIVIDSLEKKLKDLEAKPNPDFEREEKCKDSIREAEFTKKFIEARLADVTKAASATPEESK